MKKKNVIKLALMGLALGVTLSGCSGSQGGGGGGGSSCSEKSKCSGKSGCKQSSHLDKNKLSEPTDSAQS